ncbi:hypothetical protein ACYJW8_06950 [Frateuria aurantia]
MTAPATAHPARHGSGLAASLAAACLTGLAAGSLWALTTLYSQRPLEWLAPVLAWALARISRRWPLGPGLQRAALVALACGLAIMAREALLAGLIISYALGNGLLETLVHAGLGLVWQVAWLRLDRLAELYYAGALVVAACLARRMPA